MAFGKERDSRGARTYEILYPLHEIDSFNGEELRLYVNMISEQVDVVMVDFTDIVYMNSSGLRELIQILKLLKEKDKGFYLVGMSEDIRKIFTHTNLERLFTFYPGLPDAIKAVNP